MEKRLNWIDFVVMLVGIVIIYLVLGFGIAWLTRSWVNEWMLIYLNAFVTQFAFSLLIWIAHKLRGHEWSAFGFRKVGRSKVWLYVLRLYAFTWVLNVLYSLYLYQKGITPPSTDVYTKLLGQPTWLNLILNLLLAGVIAPWVEETLFRGIIYGSLRSHFGRWTAGAISATLFSGLHMQLYGFFPRFVLGLALVYLYDRYHSLYPSIALHSLNNTVATLLAAWFSG